MRRHKEIEKISEEILDLKNSTNQLVDGNLDISINTQNYFLLGDLAGDINQISMAFNSYINEISHVLSHLSSGNMAVTFTKDINYQGDFLPIKNALNKIRHSLNQSFEEINRLSSEVDILCSQVEDGSAHIAKNASEQAELINDLTSTLHQITEQTTSNTKNVKLAAKNINAIQEEALTGSDYMEEMLAAMQKVQASSNDISGIIAIISDMAEQSKLLALNASIEAARAGESGRGFSVVAREIGILAQKSADAVKQTTGLIENSMLTAEESAQIANKTSVSFRSIQSSIDSVSKLCSDLADASEIQTNKLMSTAAIITDISDSVQKDAAYAQENSAGAANLAVLSSDLKKVMSRYRLKSQKTLPTKGNQNNKIDIGSLDQLFKELYQVAGVEDIDPILEKIIREQKDFECLYVLDSQGYQLSHTIMNPYLEIEQDENFKPALPGDYHGSKRYFRQAIKSKGEWFTSFEYISTATGGLCKTLSYAFEGCDRKPFVICIDLICHF